jgi:hypothetical protein
VLADDAAERQRDVRECEELAAIAAALPVEATKAAPVARFNGGNFK